MMRQSMLALLITAGIFGSVPPQAKAQNGYSGGQVYPNAQAYGRRWGGTFSSRDYDRFTHYPYVYYPHNFYGPEYFRSRNNLYHRYVPEMRIPVYNRQWFNYYPQHRKYHKGHHFILDQF